MAILLKLVAAGVLVALVGACGLVWLALSPTPSPPPEPPLSATEITRAQHTLAGLDPRPLPPEDRRSTRVVDEADLNLVLDYLLQQRVRRGGVELRLDDGLAQLRASIAVGGIRQTRHLNVGLAVGVDGGRPVLRGARLGRFRLPPALSEALLRHLLLPLLVPHDLRGGDVPHDLDIAPGRLQYNWQPQPTAPTTDS